ncbi:MAG: CAP domain-containing protein [Actinobacteria bacterium]|nr:MAG: CAP domain-containing protein [Actinomycetota bacterium]
MRPEPKQNYYFLFGRYPFHQLWCRADLLMPENGRILSVVVFLLGLALSFGAGAGADSTPPRLASVGVASSTDGYAIVHAMNAVRLANGVPALRIGRALTRAARSHSVDMARRGYFDHGAFVQRLRRFGVRASYVGENLAEGPGGISAADVVQMWLASPPHRQNLLDRGYQRIGVGIAGGSTRFVTADFAGR